MKRHLNSTYAATQGACKAPRLQHAGSRVSGGTTAGIPQPAGLSLKARLAKIKEKYEHDDTLLKRNKGNTTLFTSTTSESG